MKSVREQLWFVGAFLKKYLPQIIGSLIVTITFVIGINYFSKFLPTQKPVYKIGIIGQFNSSQLPPVITTLISSGLTKVNDQFEPEPNIAKEWKLEDDEQTYTFVLKDSLKWQSGEDVTASSIKISIPYIDIEARDLDVLTFKMPTKFAPFPSLLNFPLINEKGKTIGKYDIKLKQKSSGIISQVILESETEKIIFNSYATPKQAITAFKLGQSDLLYKIPASEEENLTGFGLTTKQVNANQVVLLYFNQSDPVLKDKPTRQGIAYAIKDKGFGETEGFTTINPNSWAFNPLIKSYIYSPTRAKELITETLNLELSTTPELLPIAENLRVQLENENINLTIKVVTSTPDQYQLFLTTYNIPSDPDQYKDWHSTQQTNISHSTNEKLDKLLEDGRTTYNKNDRKTVYFDFQKTFAEELPALVLFHPSSINITRKESLLDIIRSN